MAVVDASAIQSIEPPRPPVIVTVTEPPRAAVVELSVRTGAAATLNGNGLELPAPAVKTVTCPVPIVARSLARSTTCSDVPARYVVARSAPFHRTTDEGRNALPLARNVNDVMPTAAAVGDK